MPTIILRAAACFQAVILFSHSAIGADAAGAAPRGTDPQAVQAVLAGTQKTAYAAWWGFQSEDSTAALQGAIDSGAEKVIVEEMGKPWIVTGIRLASDQEIVFEKGVTIEARRGAFRSKGDSLFTASGKKNITLRGYGATLRMWREDYADPEKYEKSEWRHALSIRSCSGVRVLGLTIADSGGDGIYLGVSQRGATNSDVLIKDVICDRNYRQGISVISAERLVIEDCVLSNTGGTAPMAGIDFEPNDPSERLVDCVMRRCLAEGNQGDGYVLYLKNLGRDSAPISIRLEDCRAVGNRCGFRFITGNGEERSAVGGRMEVVNGRFEGSLGSGIAVAEKPAQVCPVRLVNCRVENVAVAEPKTPPILFQSGPGNSEAVGGVEFVDCVVVDPVERLPLGYRDFGGGVKLAAVSGSITVEHQGRQNVYHLDQTLVDQWFPFQAFKEITPFDASGAKYVPLVASGRIEKKWDCSFRLRERAEYLLWAEAENRVEFTLQLQRVGRNPVQAAPVLAISPSGKEIRLSVAQGEVGTACCFTPDETGAYRLLCEPPSGTARITASNRPVCLFSERRPFHLLGSAGELFFWVPKGVAEFAVKVSGGSPGESVKASLCDPAGRPVEVKDSIESHQFHVAGEAASAGGVWSLRLERPSEGVLEDYYVQPQGIPPIMASDRDALLKPQR